MTTTQAKAEKKAKQDAAAAELRGMGAELLKKEDRFGDTKSGWWLDTVYLGPTNDARHCLGVVRG